MSARRPLCRRQHTTIDQSSQPSVERQDIGAPEWAPRCPAPPPLAMRPRVDATCEGVSAAVGYENRKFDDTYWLSSWNGGNGLGVVLSAFVQRGRGESLNERQHVALHSCLHQRCSLASQCRRDVRWGCVSVWSAIGPRSSNDGSAARDQDVSDADVELLAEWRLRDTSGSRGARLYEYFVRCTTGSVYRSSRHVRT